MEAHKQRQSSGVLAAEASVLELSHGLGPSGGACTSPAPFLQLPNSSREAFGIVPGGLLLKLKTSETRARSRKRQGKVFACLRGKRALKRRG